MLKLIKNLWNEFVAINNENARMGIIQVNSVYGSYVHIDEDTFKNYLNKLYDRQDAIPTQNCPAEE